MEILEESLNWEFNIFKLEEITERHPLLYLGMEIFRRFDVFATLNVDENICKNWLAVIERNYHADNSYHNSTHAADVMQVIILYSRIKNRSLNCLTLYAGHWCLHITTCSQRFGYGPSGRGLRSHCGRCPRC